MGTKKSELRKMKDYRITLLESHDKQLREWLTSHPYHHERGAIILFRRLSRTVNGLPKSYRFVATEIIEMKEDWILESSENHFKINMRKFPDIYLRCETENLELGFIHNHPPGYAHFSIQDDLNEKNILHGLSGCNGKFSFLISMVLTDGNWIARTRQGIDPETILELRHISVLGDNIKLYGVKMPDELPVNLSRQEIAFGKPFNAKLQSLRVAVVGLGGTGSSVATLLARTGIGELILIDGDNLEKTNMNRVRGYKGTDIGHKKAESLSTFIKSLDLIISVTTISNFLNGEAIDALSSADVILGCTDDIYGRDLMNQALYYYGLAYIDLGIAGNVSIDASENPFLQSQKGRVSCILPESGNCLRCQGVVTDQKLSNEQKFKANPELLDLDAETLAKDFYIFGAGVQSPGIGAFTSATADNAVATFMNLITEFRKLPADLRQDNIWIDFINMSIHSNDPKNDPECIYCRKKILLLKSEGKYRLGMPQLGKITDNV
jgi:molybdopterin/thiamine biosynthesis adenylyltransferase